MKKIKGIKVRKAKINDVRAIMSMSYAFFLEQLEAPESDFNAAHVQQHIVEYIMSKNADVFIAEDNGAPVGLIGLSADPAYYNHERRVVSDHHFWIEPEYRTTSVVKCIIQAAKEWSKQRGLIWLREKIVNGKRYKIQKFQGAA